MMTFLKRYHDSHGKKDNLEYMLEQTGCNSKTRIKLNAIKSAPHKGSWIISPPLLQFCDRRSSRQHLNRIFRQLDINLPVSCAHTRSKNTPICFSNETETRGKQCHRKYPDTEFLTSEVMFSQCDLYRFPLLLQILLRSIFHADGNRSTLDSFPHSRELRSSV